MTKMIYICDKCQKETKEPVELMKDKAPYKDACLCENCVADILKPAQDAPKKRRRAKEKSTAPEKRQKLDLGKMQALKNAGWSNKDIADELHTTPGTVATTLSQLRHATLGHATTKEA